MVYMLGTVLTQVSTYLQVSTYVPVVQWSASHIDRQMWFHLEESVHSNESKQTLLLSVA